MTIRLSATSDLHSKQALSTGWKVLVYILLALAGVCSVFLYCVEAFVVSYCKCNINWQSTVVFFAGRGVGYIYTQLYTFTWFYMERLISRENKQTSENRSPDLSQAWNHEPAILPYWHGGLQILSFVQQRFGAFRRSLSCKLVGSAEGGSYCNKHFKYPKYPKYQLSQYQQLSRHFTASREARRAHQRTLPWTASESIWI